ncbi:MAG: DUF4234 domain-containing protein [Acholeplasmatales bacterium]|nr:DUF4234 domain-containing protein [Acholeplasmatales bacterium]
MTKRSIVTFILLSLFTCGIYSLYWYYVTTEELNKCETSTPSIQNFIVAFLLGIITCGIYTIYWEYKFYSKFDKLYGTNNAVLYLILSILGFSIVSTALIQNSINEAQENTNAQ